MIAKSHVFRGASSPENHQTHQSESQIETAKFATLTEQEKRVIIAIAQGLSSKEIAGQLELSLQTVHFHKNRVYLKLGVRDPISLVRFAIRVGFIAP